MFFEWSFKCFNLEKKRNIESSFKNFLIRKYTIALLRTSLSMPQKDLSFH